MPLGIRPVALPVWQTRQMQQLVVVQPTCAYTRVRFSAARARIPAESDLHMIDSVCACVYISGSKGILACTIDTARANSVYFIYLCMYLISESAIQLGGMHSLRVAVADLMEVY